MIVVDAHRHYWQPGRGDYGWLDHAPQALRRAFLPGDLRARHTTAGKHYSILVQAAPSEAETRWLFELARQDSTVLGVVGWVDLDAADAAARIDALRAAGDGLLCGLRPMVQDIADPDWLARGSLDAVLGTLAEHHLALDALVTRPQWHALLKRLERQPTLRVMLDHAGKPTIGGDGFRHWAAWIDALAEFPALHCKLSGLLTELAPAQPDRAIEPYVAHLFERFGPSRLVWGSDWPVLTLRSDYDRWLEYAQDLTERYAPGRQDDVFARNALRFYARSTPSAPENGETP